MVFHNFIVGTRIFPSVCNGKIITRQRNTVDIWILSKPLPSKIMTNIFRGPVVKYFAPLGFKNHGSIMSTMDEYHCHSSDLF